MDSNLEVSMMKQRIVSLLILLVLALSLTLTASAETTTFAFDKTTVQLFEGGNPCHRTHTQRRRSRR